MTAPRRKATRLTNLRVREISSVDRGAGEGVEVTLMKRDEGEQPDPIAKGVAALHTSVSSILADDELEDKQAAIDETFAQYNDYLEQLAFDGLSPSPAEKRGHPDMPYTQADLFEEMQKRAEDYRRDGETKEQAFAKYMQTDEGRRAYAVYRTLPNPAPEQHPVAKVVAPAPSPSLERLNKLADELHNREPSLTPDQAFTKVYSDPRNRGLVAAERSENRPGLTVVEKGGGGSAPFADRVASLASSLARTHRDLSHADCIKAVLERNPVLAAAYRREQEQAA